MKQKQKLARFKEILTDIEFNYKFKRDNEWKVTVMLAKGDFPCEVSKREVSYATVFQDHNEPEEGKMGVIDMLMMNFCAHFRMYGGITQEKYDKLWLEVLPLLPEWEDPMDKFEDGDKPLEGDAQEGELAEGEQ